MTKLDRFKGAILGLAAGDALGTSIEFCSPGTFSPLTDMVGGGPFNLKAGQWTDDTSMALCLGESILHCKGFDVGDQMRRYCLWYREGHLSSNGKCFDIGNTVAGALRRYRDDGNPFSGPVALNTAGNGCIMRLAPIPMFFPDLDDVERFAADSARTTHGAEECLDACRLFARIIFRALRGQAKDAVLLGDAASFVAGERIGSRSTQRRELLDIDHLQPRRRIFDDLPSSPVAVPARAGGCVGSCPR